jgi:hypothetical protein
MAKGVREGLVRWLRSAAKRRISKPRSPSDGGFETRTACGGALLNHLVRDKHSLRTVLR